MNTSNKILDLLNDFKHDLINKKIDYEEGILNNPYADNGEIPCDIIFDPIQYEKHYHQVMRNLNAAIDKLSQVDGYNLYFNVAADNDKINIIMSLE